MVYITFFNLGLIHPAQKVNIILLIIKKVIILLKY